MGPSLACITWEFRFELVLQLSRLSPTRRNTWVVVCFVKTCLQHTPRCNFIPAAWDRSSFLYSLFWYLCSLAQWPERQKLCCSVAALWSQRGLVCIPAGTQGAGTPSVGRGTCPGPFTCAVLMQNSHLAMLEILFKRTVCILIQSTQTLLTRSVSRRISWHVKANHVNKAPQELH